MSLGFLSDHCVPRQIDADLTLRGHAVTTLSQVLPVRSPDENVIAKARELGLILLSLNGDFADIVRYPPRSHLGVIAIQLHNHPEIIPALMKRLGTMLDTHPDQQFYARKLFIVEVHRIRFRQ